MKYVVLCLVALCTSNTLAIDGADVAPKWPRRLPLQLLLSGEFKFEENDGKIVGGEAAKVGDAPFQASLRRGGIHICGASILASDKILTAAHCTDEMLVSSLSIGAGGLDRNSLPEIRSVSKIVQNPSYNKNTVDYDVSVLYLSTPLLLGQINIHNITLEDKGVTTNASHPVIVSGWGTLTEGGALSSTLQKVELSVIPNTECQRRYGSSGTITDRMMCAGIPNGGKDSCQGDSGGPLFRKDNIVQVGIVSWGIGCARPDYPGVYSKVSALRDFIDSA